MMSMEFDTDSDISWLRKEVMDDRKRIAALDEDVNALALAVRKLYAKNVGMQEFIDFFINDVVTRLEVERRGYAEGET